MDIKFISYDGKYPWLCMGTLVVKIDGKDISFGSSWHKDEPCDYPIFWSSGGDATFIDQIDWEPIVAKGKWALDAVKKSYPKHIWEILPKLIELMNEHVPYGCCGGCL